MSVLHLLADRVDIALCSAGILKSASWDQLRGQSALKLYAGRLFRGEQQFRDFVGLSYNKASTRNISHDMRDPFPLPDSCVAMFQSQDVFEHIALENMPAIISEIYRVLQPGGLFRLSLPDYRFDGYRNRCVADDEGNIIFDPGGGGEFKDGKPCNGAHLWFPVFETVKELLGSSPFGAAGSINFLHYTDVSGKSVLNSIDHNLGQVKRTPDFDPRARGPRRALSIVADCTRS